MKTTIRISALLATLLLLATVAFGQRVQTTYDFSNATLTEVDTTYFTYPQDIPDGSQLQEGYLVDQSWHLETIDVGDTATVVGYLEISLFPNNDVWVETGDTVALTGSSSGLVTVTSLNARNTRLKVIQSNQSTTTADCAVRTVARKLE